MSLFEMAAAGTGSRRSTRTGSIARSGDRHTIRTQSGKVSNRRQTVVIGEEETFPGRTEAADPLARMNESLQSSNGGAPRSRLMSLTDSTALRGGIGSPSPGSTPIPRSSEHNVMDADAAAAFFGKAIEATNMQGLATGAQQTLLEVGTVVDFSPIIHSAVRCNYISEPLDAAIRNTVACSATVAEVFNTLRSGNVPISTLTDARDLKRGLQCLLYLAQDSQDRLTAAQEDQQRIHSMRRKFEGTIRTLRRQLEDFHVAQGTVGPAANGGLIKPKPVGIAALHAAKAGGSGFAPGQGSGVDITLLDEKEDTTQVIGPDGKAQDPNGTFVVVQLELLGIFRQRIAVMKLAVIAARDAIFACAQLYGAKRSNFFNDFSDDPDSPEITMAHIVNNSFLFLVPTPIEAVAFALACHQALLEADWPAAMDAMDTFTMDPIWHGARCRVGIHNGTATDALVSSGDVEIAIVRSKSSAPHWEGPSVEKALRIGSVGLSGDVCVSQSAWAVLQQHVRAGTIPLQPEYVILRSTHSEEIKAPQTTGFKDTEKVYRVWSERLSQRCENPHSMTDFGPIRFWQLEPPEDTGDYDNPDEGTSLEDLINVKDTEITMLQQELDNLRLAVVKRDNELEELRTAMVFNIARMEEQSRMKELYLLEQLRVMEQTSMAAHDTLSATAASAENEGLMGKGLGCDVADMVDKRSTELLAAGGVVGVEARVRRFNTVVKDNAAAAKRVQDRKIRRDIAAKRREARRSRGLSITELTKEAADDEALATEDDGEDGGEDGGDSLQPSSMGTPRKPRSFRRSGSSTPHMLTARGKKKSATTAMQNMAFGQHKNQALWKGLMKLVSGGVGNVSLGAVSGPMVKKGSNGDNSSECPVMLKAHVAVRVFTTLLKRYVSVGNSDSTKCDNTTLSDEQMMGLYWRTVQSQDVPTAAIQGSIRELMTWLQSLAIESEETEYVNRFDDARLCRSICGFLATIIKTVQPIRLQALFGDKDTGKKEKAKVKRGSTSTTPKPPPAVQPHSPKKAAKANVPAVTVKENARLMEENRRLKAELEKARQAAKARPTGTLGFGTRARRSPSPSPSVGQAHAATTPAHRTPEERPLGALPAKAFIPVSEPALLDPALEIDAPSLIATPAEGAAVQGATPAEARAQLRRISSLAKLNAAENPTSPKTCSDGASPRGDTATAIPPSPSHLSPDHNSVQAQAGASSARQGSRHGSGTSLVDAQCLSDADLQDEAVRTLDKRLKRSPRAEPRQGSPLSAPDVAEVHSSSEGGTPRVGGSPQPPQSAAATNGYKSSAVGAMVATVAGPTESGGISPSTQALFSGVGNEWGTGASLKSGPLGSPKSSKANKSATPPKPVSPARSESQTEIVDVPQAAVSSVQPEAPAAAAVPEWQLQQRAQLERGATIVEEQARQMRAHEARLLEENNARRPGSPPVAGLASAQSPATGDHGSFHGGPQSAPLGPHGTLHTQHSGSFHSGLASGLGTPGQPLSGQGYGQAVPAVPLGHGANIAEYYDRHHPSHSAGHGQGTEPGVVRLSSASSERPAASDPSAVQEAFLSGRGTGRTGAGALQDALFGGALRGDRMSMSDRSHTSPSRPSIGPDGARAAFAASMGAGPVYYTSDIPPVAPGTIEATGLAVAVSPRPHSRPSSSSERVRANSASRRAEASARGEAAVMGSGSGSTSQRPPADDVDARWSAFPARQSLGGNPSPMMVQQMHIEQRAPGVERRLSGSSVSGGGVAAYPRPDQPRASLIPIALAQQMDRDTRVDLEARMDSVQRPTSGHRRVEMYHANVGGGQGFSPADRERAQRIEAELQAQGREGQEEWTALASQQTVLRAQMERTRQDFVSNLHEHGVGDGHVSPHQAPLPQHAMMGPEARGLGGTSVPRQHLPPSQQPLPPVVQGQPSQVGPASQQGRPSSQVPPQPTRVTMATPSIGQALKRQNEAIAADALRLLASRTGLKGDRGGVPLGLQTAHPAVQPGAPARIATQQQHQRLAQVSDDLSLRDMAAHSAGPQAPISPRVQPMRQFELHTTTVTPSSDAVEDRRRGGSPHRGISSRPISRVSPLRSRGGGGVSPPPPEARPSQQQAPQVAAQPTAPHHDLPSDTHHTVVSLLTDLSPEQKAKMDELRALQGRAALLLSQVPSPGPVAPSVGSPSVAFVRAAPSAKSVGLPKIKGRTASLPAQNVSMTISRALTPGPSGKDKSVPLRSSTPGAKGTRKL